jgi:type I restriction enzyme M protein
MNGNFSSVTNFIWNVADLLRDVYKRKDYPDVILPFTVLRRLDCVLSESKEEVLATYQKYYGKLEDPSAVLMKASGHNFYNISKYDFSKLLSDPANIRQNFFDYLNGFSANLTDVMERFKIRDRINYLAEKDLLYKVVQKFSEIDLGPSVISNHDMGYIFEELIRKFNEANNEEAGEHFTPREIIRLMVELLMSKDQHRLEEPGIITTVYDPACGTGGMLTVAKDHIISEINGKAQIELFGQEINDETYAVCKSDMIIKGENPDNIKPESSFSHDGFPDMTFDYILSNPPFGKDWNQDKGFIEEEYERGFSGRFGAGLPRIDDGQFLFLQHMISKMHPPETETKTRIAIVFNESPLFKGAAGSGESEIRKWIIENDWLEAIIGLPTDMFYNTGIATYIWILSNRKEDQRKGKIQLIDATQMYRKMRKSLGSKRNELSDEGIDNIVKLYGNFEVNEKSKIFDNDDFGYSTITVERSLRLNFQASPERIAHLREQPEFKKNEKELENIEKTLASLDQDRIYRNREEFTKDLEDQFFKKGMPLANGTVKSILQALSERDEAADICFDKKGMPESDPELRDRENIPLKENKQAYFDKEVKPYVPDAWIDSSRTKVGYEITFTRHFYKYVPPRPLEEIDADLKKLGEEIIDLLGELTE